MAGAARVAGAATALVGRAVVSLHCWMGPMRELDFPCQRLLECNPDSLLSRPLGGFGGFQGGSTHFGVSARLGSRPSLSRKAGEDAVPRALGSEGASREKNAH